MIRFVGVLIAVLLSSSLSFARHGGGHGGPGGEGPGMWGPKEFKELNLTKEQKDKVKAIREGSKDKGKALRQEGKEAHKKMKELLASGASKEEVTKAFDAAQSKRNEAAKFMFTQMLQIRDILTPEQRAKVKTMREEHKGRPPGPDHDDDEDGE